MRTERGKIPPEKKEISPYKIKRIQGWEKSSFYGVKGGVR